MFVVSRNSLFIIFQKLNVIFDMRMTDLATTVT